MTLLSSSGSGQGNGPERGVFDRAVEMVISDDSYFVAVGRNRSLRLHGSRDMIPRRQCFLRAAGSLIILHLIHFGALPRIVSPFLLLFLLRGRDAFTLNTEFFARNMDPTLYGYLMLLQNHPRTTAIDPNNPLYHILIDADISVSIGLIHDQSPELILLLLIKPVDVAPGASQAEFDGVLRSLLMTFTVGHTQLVHPDALAILEGFNLAIPTQVTPNAKHHILDVSCSDLRSSGV